jgi:ferredoxin/flavodoxin---NADP+ reductase
VTTYDVDLLIVGAGPVGLYGTYYAGVRGLRTAVIDSSTEIGGQVTAMYPEKQIYDVAGYPAVKGRELVDALGEQAAAANAIYLLGQEARRLATGADRRHLITTSTGDEIWCGAVVITAGIGAFEPRKLAVGEDYLGNGFEYFVPDPEPYGDVDVVIVGGGDSALDWALMLEDIAASVTVVHRRNFFRAHAATVTQVEGSTVELVTDAEVRSIGGNGTITHADVVIKGDNKSRRLRCQRVIAALGFIANMGPLRNWGLTLRDNRHVVVDSAMRTGRPGIFAAGDVVDYDGKVRLISTGFGEVATAVNNAAVHIHPGAQLFPGHSTDDADARQCLT